MADWLKSKGLHKLSSVFEGIQEPFILSLACKSVVLNHVYRHSFRNIIKATEKFPGGGGIWTAFRLREGGIWTKILQKIQMPGGCPGGDVEASIWLVHYFSQTSWWIFKKSSENHTEVQKTYKIKRPLEVQNKHNRCEVLPCKFVSRKMVILEVTVQK